MLGLHSHINDCRDFVSSYWPNPGTKGSQVKSMYDRLAAIDTGPSGKESASATEGSNANGQTNGIAVRQDQT